jgi:leader peptidase (prepilin peptidase)/N-methyltransferase
MMKVLHGSIWLEAGFDRSQLLRRLLIAGLVGLSLGLLSYTRYGATPKSLITAICCWLLLALAIIDLDQRLIPNHLVYLGVAIALAGSFIVGAPRPLSAMAGALIGYGIFWIIVRVRPGAMGGGDVRLAGLIGLMVGFHAVIWALLAGMILAGLVALALVLGRRARLDQTMAYGPYLVMGAWIMLLLF